MYERTEVSCTGTESEGNEWEGRRGVRRYGSTVVEISSDLENVIDNEIMKTKTRMNLIHRLLLDRT